MASKNTKPSCNKVKNPCKFCLQQVTGKNGLQCQGACKKWAHYKCLNYTPGKISDIKAGIIKVTCPCPDCETTQPKEFLTNPPFTCSNHQCPANKTPKCESYECPSNKRGRSQSPDRPVPPVEYPSAGCPNSSCSNQAVPCPAKESPNGQPNEQRISSHPRISSPRPPTPPRTSVPRGRSPQASQQGYRQSRKSCPDDINPPSEKSPRRSSAPCPKDCGTNEAKPRKSKPIPKKSPSCSLISSDTSACKPCPNSSSSESNIGTPGNQASMVQALQEMCSTVGKLSVQLKDLMCKMMQT